MEQNSSDPATNVKPRRGRPKKSENDKNKHHHIRLRKSKPRAVKVIAPAEPFIRVKKTSTITKTNLKSQSDATQTGLSISSPAEPHTPAAIKSNIHSLITITSPTNGTKKLLLVTDKTYPPDFHSVKINCNASNVTSSTTTTTTTTTSVADNNQILYQISNNKPGMVILTTGSQTQSKMQPKQYLLIPTSGTSDLSLINPSLTAISSSQNKLIASQAANPADRINQSVTSNSSPLHDKILVKSDLSDSDKLSGAPLPTAAKMTVPNKVGNLQETNVHVRKHVSILPKSAENASDYATQCAKLRESVENIRGNRDITGTSENSKIITGSCNLKTACLTQKCAPSTLVNNGMNCSLSENNGSNQLKCNFSSVDNAKTSLNSPTVPHTSSGLSFSKSESISQKKVDPKRPYGPRARKSFPKVYDIPASIKSTVPFSPVQLTSTSRSLWSMAPSNSKMNSSSIPAYSLHSPSQEFISQTSFISDHHPVPISIADYKQTLSNILPHRNVSINQNTLEICTDSNKGPILSRDMKIPPVPSKRQIYSSPPKLTIAPGFSSVKSKQKNSNKKKKSPSNLLVIKEREEFFDDCTPTNVPGDMSPPKLEREDGYGFVQNDPYPPNLQPQYQTNTQLSSTLLQNHTDNMAPSLPDRSRYAAGLKKNRKLSFGKLFSCMLAKSSKYKKSINHYTILFEIARSIHCCVVLSELGYCGSVDLKDLPYRLVTSIKCSKRCRQQFMKTASSVGSLPLFKRPSNGPLIKDDNQMIKTEKPASLHTSNLDYPTEFSDKNIIQSDTLQMKHFSGNYVSLLKQPELRSESFIHAPVMKPQFYGNPGVPNSSQTLNTHSQTLDTEHNYFKLSNDKLTANYTNSYADINKESLPIFNNNCGNESVPNSLNTFSKAPNNAALSSKAAISNTGALITPLPPSPLPPPPFSTENSIIGKLKYEIVPKEKFLSMNCSSNMIPVTKNQNDACKNGILKGNSNNQLVPNPKNLGYKNAEGLEKTTISQQRNISCLTKSPEQLLLPSKSEIIIKKKKFGKNKIERKRKTFDEKMQLLKENECFMNNTINSALTNNVMSKLTIKKNIKKQSNYEHAPSLEEVKSFYNEPTTTDRVVMLDPNDRLITRKKSEKEKKVPKKRGRPPKDRSFKLSEKPCVKTQFGKRLLKRKYKKAKLQKVKTSGSMNSLIIEIQEKLTRNQGNISKDIKPVLQCPKKLNIQNIIDAIYMASSRKKKVRLSLSSSKLNSVCKKPVNWKKIARQPFKNHDFTENSFDIKSKTARKLISTTVSNCSSNPNFVTCKTELKDTLDIKNICTDLINTQKINEYQTSLNNFSTLNNSSTTVSRPPGRKRGRPAKLKVRPVSGTLNYDHTYQTGTPPCDNSLLKNSSAVAKHNILQASKKSFRRRKSSKRRGKYCLSTQTTRLTGMDTKVPSHNSVSLMDDHSSNLQTDMGATEEIKLPCLRKKRKIVAQNKAWKKRKKTSKIHSKHSNDVLERQVLKCPCGTDGENITNETKLPLTTGSLLSCSNMIKECVRDNIDEDKIIKEPSVDYDDVLSENNIFKKHDCKKTFDNVTELPPSSPVPILVNNSSDVIKLVPSKSVSLQQPLSPSLDSTECDNFSESNMSPFSKTSQASMYSQDDLEQTFASSDVTEVCHPCGTSPDDTETSPKFSLSQPSPVNLSANDNSFTIQPKYSETDQEANITRTHHSALLNKFNVGLTPELARIQRLKDKLEQQKKTIDIVKQKLS
ncbi:uncharacterized protein LOC115210682 [Octopus sinensis]|uniref:Uncharacterized protein LOC115210682 n=1 Tax=Octopus sinensis TaxID=2607531 RepID=A0A6P7SAB9_9MOLL|nr:uncharacterized protein LOC115210682 [Octopus sinensis]XP_029635216.1 uncharacterized protein LOC115210682 [Octopus sinensis]XP_029635217.1 uncharacterized protein LOC115210682 [Octopus sinensis]